MMRNMIFENSNDLIYASSAMTKSVQVATRAAATDSGILITGETGTGKEMLARFVHKKSLRNGKPFIPINCANIQDNLFESELFGFKKGAFTGAEKSKKGLVEMADKGTLFLDEVGEMPLDSQPRFLRFLETKSFLPVGSEEFTNSDTRIIAATNRDLKSMVDKGSFREDLYFRLNILEINIPPLRERKEDIGILVKHFMSRFKNINTEIGCISRDALNALMNYNFPGNIRELSNILERAFILSTGKNIEVESLNLFQPGLNEPINSELDTVIKRHILKTLESVNNDKTRAATILNIDRSTLYRKLKEYGVV